MFADLHEHVQQTFSAFMGYDEYEQQLTIWTHLRRAAANERAREWAAKNREKERARAAENYRKRKEARLAKRRRAEQMREANKRWRARNLDAARAADRERQRAVRAERRAA